MQIEGNTTKYAQLPLSKVGDIFERRYPNPWRTFQASGLELTLLDGRISPGKVCVK
jgi:hypothetical protein